MIATKEEIRGVIESSSMTYEQKHHALANAAERMLDPRELLDYSKEEYESLIEHIICDLNEGYGIYRPRYILPNYSVFIKQGCAFLELEKPDTLEDLLEGLRILYHHVPSITSFPVYIGELDTMINPFITNEEQDYHIIKRFLNYIDKTISDSFCHGNLSGRDTAAGRLILKAVEELENPTPNLTMKLDPDNYDSEFLQRALKTALKVAKPSFANHKIYGQENSGYGIASCYNALPIGGGAYTLPRLKLGTLVKKAHSKEDFINSLLPKYTGLILSMIDKRIRYLIKQSNFFETSFLVSEGFIDKDLFQGMVGIIGLADCVNELLIMQGIKETFGQSEIGDRWAHEILQIIEDIVKNHRGVSSQSTNNNYILHAQVGASLDKTDRDNTPAHRIKVGEEPALPLHLMQSSKLHQYFPSGVGDVFSFDQTYLDHIDALEDILIGGFKEGHRYLSFYGENRDLVRVTGYLVKRSEVEKARKEEVVRRDTTMLGAGTDEMSNVFRRRRRSNE
jgi:YjjI family glycine radical enzyme